MSDLATSSVVASTTAHGASQQGKAIFHDQDTCESASCFHPDREAFGSCLDGDEADCLPGETMGVTNGLTNESGPTGLDSNEIETPTGTGQRTAQAELEAAISDLSRATNHPVMTCFVVVRRHLRGRPLDITLGHEGTLILNRLGEGMRGMIGNFEIAINAILIDLETATSDSIPEWSISSGGSADMWQDVGEDLQPDNPTWDSLNGLMNQQDKQLSPADLARNLAAFDHDIGGVHAQKDHDDCESLRASETTK